MSEVRITSPFPPYAWPRVWSWIQEFPDRVCDDFSPHDSEAFVAAQMGRSYMERSWAVWRGEELVGIVTFRPWNPIVGDTFTVFKRAVWGRGVALKAMRLVAEELFASGVKTIAATVYSDNLAIRHIVKQLGGRQVGTLSCFTQRRGELVSGIILEIPMEAFYAAADNGRHVDRGGGVGESVEDRNEHPDVLGGADGLAGGCARDAIEAPGEPGEPVAAQDGGDRQD